MKNNIVITGTNRGLGLEFVRQYLAAGDHVIAACRDPKGATHLQKLSQEFPKTLRILPLDVRDPKQIDQFAHEIRNETIDILINNAGVYGPHGMHLGRLHQQAWLDVFNVNTVAPLLLAQALLPQIERSQKKLIVAVSTRMASISDNDSGDAYIYRSSKAALNAAFKSLAIDINPRGIHVLLLHPGWVKTDMGGKDGLIEVDESVKGMRTIIETTAPNSEHLFYAYDGRELSW